MSKLYSVKEIAEMLNKELEESGVSYRYTEERVRSRLRYLRSRTTTESRALQVTPKILGYDKRAKYYTEEDVEKLRGIWVGPMLAEFETYVDGEAPSDEDEEVEVREATTEDKDPLIELIAANSSASQGLQEQLARQLKAAKSGIFVAFTAEGELIGWSRAEVSHGMSMLQGIVVGMIYVFVSADKKEKAVATRALIYRAKWWLKSQKAARVIAVVPAAMSSLGALFEEMNLQNENDLMLLAADN